MSRVWLTEPQGRLDLPQVTLCAAASVNVAATVSAMRRCLEQVRFGEALIFTDAVNCDLPENIRAVPIAPLRSVADYSHFMLRDLHRWMHGSHCLVVQWDGFVIDNSAWKQNFLEMDYIGAPWPQFNDGYDVGNGGFSLRSRRLLEACQSPVFVYDGEAEDVAICRTNRLLLERDFGIRFADRLNAGSFSFERDHKVETTFGFHGVFNLIEAVGPEEFWEIYCSLDSLATIRPDFWSILRGIAFSPGGIRKAVQMMRDRFLRGIT